jgi:hypothetical protein
MTSDEAYAKRKMSPDAKERLKIEGIRPPG